MRYRGIWIRFATSRKAMLLTKLQRATSLLDRPHRPQHGSRNVVAHAARVRAPLGLVSPGGLRGLCAVSLPLAAIVVVLTMGRGLALRLWLAMRLGLAFVLAGAVRLRSRRILGAFSSSSVRLFWWEGIVCRFRRHGILCLFRRQGSRCAVTRLSAGFWSSGPLASPATLTV